MTQKFIDNIWQKDCEPELLKEFHADYRRDRKQVLKHLKVGDELEQGYVDKDQFEITKINKKTGEITVEYAGSTGF